MNYCTRDRRDVAVLVKCLVVTLILSHWVTPLRASAIVLNFDSLDASGLGGLTGAPITEYFAGYGISVSGDPLAVYDVRNLLDRGREYTAPASRTNFLGGTRSPQTNTLNFSIPLQSLSFIRNSLIVTGPGGTSHPEWSATAYDASGNVLDSVGEAMIATFTNIPLTSFELTGPNIKSVAFHSDHHNFAGYPAVILDDLTLVVPEPYTLLLGVIAAVPLCVMNLRGKRRYLTHVKRSASRDCT